jgi:pimeloyl-ACP methyl ester carboxylesterase
MTEPDPQPAIPKSEPPIPYNGRMSKPVVVIHGIGIRNPAKFLRSCDSLGSVVGEGYDLIPVFWGDLGASDEHLDKVIARYPERSGGMRGMMADKLAASVASKLGRTMSWVSRKRGDDAAADRIGEQTGRLHSDLRGRVRGYVNGKFQDMRVGLTATLLPFMADVIAYQSHGRRAVVHARMRETIDKELGPEYGTTAKPVTVIAHSLGGVISFDMATAEDEPLHIDHFITLGSQPGFFHLLDPRSGLVPPFDGEPVTLPGTIRRWTNIWDEYDMLAFGVGDLFRLHDGTVPIDRPVRCYRDVVRGAAMMQSHLGYFTRRASVTAVAEALGLG